VSRGLFRTRQGWTSTPPQEATWWMWASLCDPCAQRALREEARLERRARARRLLALSGGGRRWLRLSLRTYPRDVEGEVAWRAAVEWLYRLAVGEEGNLLLYGPPGTGKTGLAWGIVRCLCERRVPALLVGWRDLLALLKEGFGEGNGPSAGERLLARARRVRVLALDDVGAERPTPFALDELAGLVESRYSAALPTIVTSNYAPEELAQRMGDPILGERVVSRLLEGATRVRFAGRNRRLP
jgi:DNA replication protein DnaC